MGFPIPADDTEALEQMLSDTCDELNRTYQRMVKLQHCLVWVRANYAAGPTAEINARIDEALKAEPVP